MVGLLHFVFCGCLPVVLSWRQTVKLNTGLHKVTLQSCNNDHTPLWVCEIPSADTTKLNKGENEGFNPAHRQERKEVLLAFNSLIWSWLLIIWQIIQKQLLTMSTTSIYYRMLHWFSLLTVLKSSFLRKEKTQDTSTWMFCLWIWEYPLVWKTVQKEVNVVS